MNIQVLNILRIDFDFESDTLHSNTKPLREKEGRKGNREAGKEI